MKQSFRYLLYITLGAVLFAGGVAYAKTSDYLIVKDLPFIGQTTSLAGYLKGLFLLGIGIAVTLAVVMGVIRGIQYMFSDIPGVKGAAKGDIMGIGKGLIFAFGCWLVLYTINPNLIEFDFVTSLEEAAREAARDVPPPPPDNPGAAWPDDTRERLNLAAAGISVKTPTCTTEGQKGCTSVHGLSRSAIEGLINLKTRCNTCSLIVTGGTEYWLHKTHGDTRTVDLRNTSSLTNYIGGEGTSCFQAKQKDGLTFHWEDVSCGKDVSPHWHISF